MYNALGGWPESIGTRGFPETLIFHIKMHNLYLSYLLGCTVFLIPIIILICFFCGEMALSFKVLIDTDYWINCLFSPNVVSSA